jgi:predicted kinase
MNNSQEQIHEQQILSRPSATSSEYQQGQLRAASIHNIIEQQSWEKRVGVSDNFDPERRGYTISRANNGLPLRGQDCNRNQHVYNQRDRREYRHENQASGLHGTNAADGRPLNETCLQSHHDGIMETVGSARADCRVRQTGQESRQFRNVYDGTYRESPRVNNRHDTLQHRSPVEHSAKGRGYHFNRSGHNDRRGNDYHNRDAGRNENNYRNSSRSPRYRPNEDNDNDWRHIQKRTRGHNNRCRNELPPPATAFVPPTTSSSNSNFEQFMLLLTGIPGSGKSTFAESLVSGKPYIYVRVNQDALGSRVACEELTRKVLGEGKCPIIDRCNFDPKQRRNFLNIAKSCNVPVDCLVFQFPMDLCIRRCQERRNHETITEENAAGVVRLMLRQFSPPLPNRINTETFRNIKTLDSLDAFNDLVLEYLNIML